MNSLGNLVVLALVYLAYIFISFWLFNGNFLSPSFVFSVSMSLTLWLAYYAAVSMGMLFAIKIETALIFGFAGFVFLATEFFVYAMNTVKVLDRGEPVLNIKHQPLVIDPQFQWAFTALLAVSFVLALLVLYLNTGGGSFSQRIAVYKRLVIHDQTKLRGYFIVSQLYKIGLAGADLCAYVLLYNLTVCGAKIREVLSYIIDMVLYALLASVFTGARVSAIELILFMMMIYITLNMTPGGRKKIYACIRKMLPVMVLIACLFTAAGALVGRDVGDRSRTQYLAEYVSGGLYAFNTHLDEGASTKRFGEASFAHVYSILQKAGLMAQEGTMVYGQFDIYGNTVTIFGRWYRDFGAIGVFIMASLVSLCYSSVFYGRIIHSGNITKEHHMSRIFYCQFIMSLVWAGFDDRIATLMTVQTAVFLIFVTAFYKLLIVDKLKIF